MPTSSREMFPVFTSLMARMRSPIGKPAFSAGLGATDQHYRNAIELNKKMLLDVRFRDAIQVRARGCRRSINIHYDDPRIMEVCIVDLKVRSQKTVEPFDY